MNQPGTGLARGAGGSAVADAEKIKTLDHFGGNVMVLPVHELEEFFGGEGTPLEEVRRRLKDRYPEYDFPSPQYMQFLQEKPDELAKLTDGLETPELNFVTCDVDAQDESEAAFSRTRFVKEGAQYHHRDIALNETRNKLKLQRTDSVLMFRKG